MKRTRAHGLSAKGMELVQLLVKDCETTGDVQAMLKKLFAGAIEHLFEAEMDEHLGYEKNSGAGNNSGNSGNGNGKKTITSEYGECEIAVPRDSNGEFEPKVIEKSRLIQMKLSRKFLQCTQKKYLSVILNIPFVTSAEARFHRDLFRE